MALTSYTEVDVCNRALDKCKAANISALTDPTKEGRKCKAWYPLIRDSLLEEHTWGFTEKRESLAVVSDEDPSDRSPYTYAYKYPADCLVAIRLYNDASPTQELDFILQANEAGNNIEIWTNVENAILEYTKATNTFTLMRSGTFIETLIAKLAANICYSLSGDSKREQELFNQYFAFSTKAKVKDSNEQYENVENDRQYIDAEL